MKQFSEILLELTGGMDPIFTIDQIARIVERSPKTVYSWRDGDAEPRWSDVVKLSKMAGRRGYLQIAAQMFPSGQIGQANGTIEDEYYQIVQILGRATEDFRPGRREQFMNHVEQLRSQLANLKAEAKKL